MALLSSSSSLSLSRRLWELRLSGALQMLDLTDSLIEMPWNVKVVAASWAVWRAASCHLTTLYRTDTPPSVSGTSPCPAVARSSCGSPTSTWKRTPCVCLTISRFPLIHFYHHHHHYRHHHDRCNRTQGCSFHRHHCNTNHRHKNAEVNI